MRTSALFEKMKDFDLAQTAKDMNIYPYFREIVSSQDTEVILKGGQKVLMLGSNSYMGLTNHPEVKEAAVEAVRKYGSSTVGSRFLNGTMDLHVELEAELADWVGKEAALLYSTGFQTNQGLISAFATRHDHVIMDKLAHASLIDGAKLSDATTSRFPHNDDERLDKMLSEITGKKGVMVITEGIFSMHGDIARLPEIAAAATKHNAALLVDDAHALGVLGPEGSGSPKHFGVLDQVDFIMGTFSKSLASIGGFIAADADVIEYLKHHSRALIFSAAMAPASAAAARAAVRVIRREPERLEALWKITRMTREGLQSIGFKTGLSETPIIPVYVGDMLLMAHFTMRLQEEGLFVNPVVPPAVPPSDTLIRISLMATHTPAQIDFALSTLERVAKEMGILPS